MKCLWWRKLIVAQRSWSEMMPSRSIWVSTILAWISSLAMTQLIRCILLIISVLAFALKNLTDSRQSLWGMLHLVTMSCTRTHVKVYLRQKLICESSFLKSSRQVQTQTQHSTAHPWNSCQWTRSFRGTWSLKVKLIDKLRLMNSRCMKVKSVDKLRLRKLQQIHESQWSNAYWDKVQQAVVCRGVGVLEGGGNGLCHPLDLNIEVGIKLKNFDWKNFRWGGVRHSNQGVS